MKLKQITDRYLWVVNLFLCFWLAYFTAGLFNFKLAEKYFPTPIYDEKLASALRPKDETLYKPSTQKILERNLFQLVEQMPGEQAQGFLDMSVPPIRAQLLGIIFFCTGSKLNRATITLLDGNKSDVYKIEDEIANGVKLSDIGEKKVVLTYPGGRKEELFLEETPPPEAQQASVYPGQSPFLNMPPEERAKRLAAYRQALSPGEGIERVSDTEYKIARPQIDQALSNLNELFTQARMVPNFVDKDGQRVVDGFRVFQIKPGGIFQKLGIYNGDILRSINGVQMDNVERAFELLQQLRFENRFEIEILRGQQNVNMRYQITD